MLVLPVPSATFDERLIQRSGSGETDNSSSNSGLVTPQEESGQPLVSLVDLKHANKAIASTIDQQTFSRDEDTPALGCSNSQILSVLPASMARMVSSVSGSSISQSPEFEDPEVTHQRAKKVYSLPNRHISIEIKERDEVSDMAMGDMVDEFGQPTKGLCSILGRKWNKKQVGEVALRVLLFLPWCVAVGAGIVCCPSKLDAITFQTGYLESLSGIHRFAHWADRTSEHMVIFIAFLGCLAWLSPAVGVILVCAVGALAVNAWHDFRLDPTIPLGEDDRQSVYLSITKFWLTDEFLNLRRERNGYMLDVKQQEKRTREVDNSESE